MRTKKRKRPKKNRCAAEELEAPIGRNKEEDVGEVGGDIPNIVEEGGTQVSKENQASETASKTLQKKSKKSETISKKPSDEAPNKRRKVDKTSRNRAAIKRPLDKMADSGRNKEEDVREARGDLPNILEEGGAQVSKENRAAESASKTLQKKNKKSQTRSKKPSDEAPNKRRKVDKTSRNRAAIKRPLDKMGDNGRNKKKKVEKPEDPGEGPSAPISTAIAVSHRRGNKRSHTSEDTGGKKKFKTTTGGSKTPQEPSAASHPLGSLTFHGKIGEGSFGKVLLASHSITRQQLAVKIVQKRTLVTDFRDSLFIERDILAITGESAFFTHGYAALQTPDHVLFIMEYLNGGDLDQFIQRRAPCDISTTRFIAAELVCGLRFLHTRGIIHRDMKPENVLLDAAGHVKIADFGLAVKNIHGHKKIRECAGTVGYMAPEIMCGAPYDSMVDIFSFGVIFYQMATGSYPFYAGEESTKIGYSVIYDAPTYPKNLDPEIRNILHRLLSKSPRKRQEMCTNLTGHPFFCPINWEELEAGRTTPPFTLQPTPITIRENVPLDELLSSPEAQEPPMSVQENRLFHGFSFTSDRWKTMQAP